MVFDKAEKKIEYVLVESVVIGHEEEEQVQHSTASYFPFSKKYALLMIKNEVIVADRADWSLT